MGLFGNLFKSLVPTPKPVTVPLASLPKITAPKAADIVKSYKPEVPAQGLLKPTQTPAEYLQVLEQNKQSGEAINLLAHGMPERESVWYACQSSQKVAGQLAPADKTALQAAEAWVKNPTGAAKANAAAAAAKTDFQGPGAWAAQAAAFSQSPTGAIPATGLTGHASAGSVKLASAMANNVTPPKVSLPEFKPNVPAAPTLPGVKAPQAILAPPEPPPLTLDEQVQAAQMQQPFVDLGKDIACGKNTWT